MTWAELRDLLEALPADSATKAAAAGDTEGRRWNTSTYLQAAQYSALQMVVRILWAAHLEGSPPAMEPIETPRLEAAEQDEADQAKAQQAAEDYLDSFSPSRRQAQDPEQIAELQEAIHALEAQQQ